MGRARKGGHHDRHDGEDQGVAHVTVTWAVCAPALKGDEAVAVSETETAFTPVFIKDALLPCPEALKELEGIVFAPVTATWWSNMVAGVPAGEPDQSLPRVTVNVLGPVFVAVMSAGVAVAQDRRSELRVIMPSTGAVRAHVASATPLKFSVCATAECASGPKTASMTISFFISRFFPAGQLTVVEE